MGRPKKALFETGLGTMEPEMEQKSTTESLTKGMFEQVIVDDTILDPGYASSAEKVPSPRDPEWPDFLLGKLNESEKDKKNSYPKAPGLRRLVLAYVGDIIDSFPDTRCMPDSGNDFNAVVEHHLTVETFDGKIKKLGGVGEANRRNSDKPYDKYLLSVASSRAISRAFKEALNVSFVTAEEVSEKADEDEDDSDANEMMTSAQKAAINMLCKKLNIDSNKFVNLGKLKYDDGLEDISITKLKARGMMSLLNAYVKDNSTIPEGVKL